MKCNRCGAEQQDNSKFCNNCGASFIPAQPTANPAPLPKKKKSGCVVASIGCGGFVVLCLILGMCGLIVSSPTQIDGDSEALSSSASEASATSSEGGLSDEERFAEGVYSVLEYHEKVANGEDSPGSLAAFKINVRLYEGFERQVYYYALYGQMDYISEFGDSELEGVRSYINEVYEKYDASKTVDYLDNIGEEKQQAEAQSRSDYIESAQYISYDNLVREPYNYEGEALAITVTVSQIMPGGILTESGYRAYDAYGNEWYIHYNLPDNVPRIIENDTVTFYGEYAGITEMTRALTGVKDQVPKLNGKYHQF